MTFLPIVQRELRVASRRKSTYRLRSWTAIIAIGVSFVSLVFFLLTGRARANIGNLLFANLTSCAFGLCLLAGVFLTADSLSEEKREGTLGLLFLTDLCGYDIVLGKFVAMLLRALYGLLALLPIIALSLLLGGVTGGELWRRALALINGLFVSLAAGIWVSAFVRDSQAAMGRVFGLMFMLVVALPSAGSLPLVSPIIRLLNLVSPFSPFSYSSAALYFGDRSRFWAALAVSHGVGWLFLVIASRALPRRWQEGGEVRLGSLMGRLLHWRRGSPEKRLAARRELLTINPILWLVSSEAGFGRLAWLIVLVWAGLVGLLLIFAPREAVIFVQGRYGMPPFGFLLKAIFTVQVCRFFAEARRNGALEMLLSTPLTNREIIRGQFAAIRRAYLWPGAVFVGVLFVPMAFQVMTGLHALNFDQLMTGTGGFLLSTVNAVRMVADLFALFWLGLWLALTMKKPSLAPALTMLFVIILPAFLCCDIFVDLLMIKWCSTRLRQDLRWVLARQYQSRLVSPRSFTFDRPPAGVPPVIAKR